ncbi:MAG: STAS-like domain-containing protein [Candidatus Sedimenticola sp. (ex Thyasira tokunagai)]
MSTQSLKISDEFSRYPAGRYYSDGPYSGEKFREEFLSPRLREGANLEINLDGTRGFGSSFLEEAFGGLVRKGFKAVDLLHRLTFISKDESLVTEIKEYINGAS